MKRAFLAGFLLTVLGASGLTAGVPKAAIDGPTKARPCQLIELSAAESKSADGGLAWAAVGFPEEDLHRVEGGERVFIVAPKSGRVTVILFAVDLEDGKAVVDSLTWTVVVDGGEPGPGPGPDPEPPVPPDGSLSEQVKALKATVDLPPERLAKSSAALAAAFETLATRIGAGGYASVDELLAGLEARVAAALGSDLGAWSEFRDKLGALFEQLADAKKLETLDDHAAMFLEVAKGLR